MEVGKACCSLVSSWLTGVIPRTTLTLQVRGLQIWVIDHEGNLHRDNETTVQCFEKMLGKEDGDYVSS